MKHKYQCLRGNHGLGGFSQANETAYQIEPELFSRNGADSFFTPKIWFSYLCLWSFTLPMFPQIFMRFYTPKTSESLKVSVILYPIITIVLFICPVIIGVWGHIAFPDLVGKATDQILPLMLTEYTPIWLSSVVMVGALSAFMSTLDSQLLALSSILVRDIYLPYCRKNASLSEQTFVGRFLIVGLAIIGLILAYKPPSTILALATQGFTGLSVLFPTVIAALYGKNISPISCIISILVGETMLLGFQFGWIRDSFTFGFLRVVPIVAICSVIIILGINRESK